MIFGMKKFSLKMKPAGMDDLLGGGGPAPKADEPIIEDELLSKDLEIEDDLIVDPITEDLELRLKTIEAEKKLMQDELENKLKSARDDAAKKRLQNKELKSQASEIFSVEREILAKEIAELKKQTKELESFKKKEELNDREIGEQLELTKIEIESQNKALIKANKKAEESQLKLQEFLDQQKETEDIQNQILGEKINEIIESLPEDKRKYANLIAKGEGDIKSGLYALMEAKNEGLFGVKKVVVAHQVPRQDADINTNNKKITSKNKISQGLRTIRGTGVLTPGTKIV